ncbi:hypothetical protein, partial [Iamia sp.]|uniref:hypothetical protein n=1 Tax=Iamia sp. TaxID=2722710 RepID=UPI002CFC09A1
ERGDASGGDVDRSDTAHLRGRSDDHHRWASSRNGERTATLVLEGRTALYRTPVRDVNPQPKEIYDRLAAPCG